MEAEEVDKFQNTFTFPHFSQLHKVPHILGCLSVELELLKEEVYTKVPEGTRELVE